MCYNINPKRIYYKLYQLKKNNPEDFNPCKIIIK